jgi:hypothetical protein
MKLNHHVRKKSVKKENTDEGRPNASRTSQNCRVLVSRRNG